MRIDFYVSQDSLPEARLQLAYRLARRAWQGKLPVWLRCSDQAQCQQMSEMLWHWRAEFFLPHSFYSDNPADQIVLACEQPPSHPNSVLINLAQDMPSIDPKLNRIIELVCQEPSLLEQSRQNFLAYRKLGHQPQRVEL